MAPTINIMDHVGHSQLVLPQQMEFDEKKPWLTAFNDLGEMIPQYFNRSQGQLVSFTPGGTKGELLVTKVMTQYES